MTLDELKAAQRNARKLPLPLKGTSVVLYMNVPTAIEMLRLGNISENARESAALFNYRLLMTNIDSWEGVREKDIAGDGDTPLPFSNEAVELYFATRAARIGEVADAVMKRYEELKAAQEAERKN